MENFHNRMYNGLPQLYYPQAQQPIQGNMVPETRIRGSSSSFDYPHMNNIQMPNIPRQASPQVPHSQYTGINKYNGTITPMQPLQPLDDSHWGKVSRQQRFKQDLDMQVQLKQERLRKEKKQLEIRMQKEEEEMRMYNPFGRAGAGAPICDKQGNIVTNLRLDNPNNLPPKSENENINTQAYKQQATVPTVDGKFLPKSEPFRAAQGVSDFFTPRSTGNFSDSGEQRYSRFQFDRAPPEVQNEIMDKHRKQQEVERSLREQLEEKQKRKQEEQARLRREERQEEERLEREREELRIAYEREKGWKENSRSKKAANSGNQSPKKSGNSTNPPESPRTLPWSPQPDRGSLSNVAVVSARKNYPSHAQLPMSPRATKLFDTTSSRERHFKRDRVENNQLYLSSSRNRAQVTPRLNEQSSRIGEIRSELLSEHDSLRRQMRKQEDLLNNLKHEIEVVKNQRDKLHRIVQNTHNDDKQLLSKSRFVTHDGEPMDIMLQDKDFMSSSNQIQEKLPGNQQNKWYSSGNNDLERDVSDWDGSSTDQLDELLQAFVHKERLRL